MQKRGSKGVMSGPILKPRSVTYHRARGTRPVSGFVLKSKIPARAQLQGQGSKALDEGRASSAGSFANISMNGSEVFKFAVRAVPTVSTPARPSLYRLYAGGLV